MSSSLRAAAALHKVAAYGRAASPNGTAAPGRLGTSVDFMPTGVPGLSLLRRFYGTRSPPKGTADG
jgi:hypothetical protein